MRKLVWYLKQLFPFNYVTTYREEGEKRLTIWRMWFGRCFNIQTYALKE